MESKLCQQCGSDIHGRIDKKFCDDQCRAAYNNRLHSDTPLMRHITNVLRKNRKILEDLIPPEEGKTKASRRRLEDKGFNFIYHTHTYTTKTGYTYLFCYEYGLLELESNNFMLVKRSD
jgi:hypothetical protein